MMNTSHQSPRSPHSLRPRLTVDLSALRANYALLAARRPDAALAAVVKADCYGLGVARIAPALFEAGCRTFFVAYAIEGIALRDILARHDPEAEALVCVFNGPSRGDVDEFTANGLTPVLNTLEQLRLWRQAGNGAGIVHVDTGMNRLGLTRAEVGEILSGDAWRAVEVSHVMSHLAFGANADAPQNERQARDFAEIAARLCAYWPGAAASFSASAGLFLPLALGRSTGETLVRPGLALYGAGPQDAVEPALATVAALEAPVLQLRDIEAGETCGYSGTFTAGRPTRLATLGIGYADGYARALSNRGIVRLGGADCPVVGNVSMDLIIADVTDCPEPVAAGDMAECFGLEIKVEEHAARAGTIAYEIFTGLGPRVERVYKG